MSTWVFKQWPIPLVAATALIVLLFAQRFGVSVGLPDATSTTELQPYVGFCGQPGGDSSKSS
jgi:hypothetical protein